MNRDKLESATEEELAEYFVAIAVVQDKAMRQGENADAARQALQIISDREEYPQAADARGMIRAVDDGTFVPSQTDAVKRGRTRVLKP
jgi:predicted transcriptional regulator